MTLPLLKTALEPVVRRQRSLGFMLGLAGSWIVLTIAAFILLKFGVYGGGVAAAFGLAGIVAWFAARRWAAAWAPDYLAIARKIEERHLDLHALLITAVEQQPDQPGGA